MSPKTAFSVPIKKSSNANATTIPMQGNQRICSTEEDVPLNTDKSKSSRSRDEADERIEVVQTWSSEHALPDNEKSHTLQFTESQEDDLDDCEIEEAQPQSHVCSHLLFYYVLMINALNTLMYQWLQVRSRYLHL